MAQLIDKAAVVAEIERKADIICQGVFSEEATMGIEYFKESLISFLDTLDVKEVAEYDDSDMDTVLSELGVEPDSSFANSFKNAFYKAFDSYLNKKN